jgi:hypothetical protein
MLPRWTAVERSLLQRLDDALRSESVRAAIDEIVGRVEATMIRDPETVEAWEPVPLDVYGPTLPDEVRSSWVFILRGGMASGAERHPNSRQRMTSWKGGGDFRIHDGRRWRSHFLTSDPRAPLEERWVSIAPMAWHQGVVPEKNWVVLSFHTVPADELVEERPSPSDPEETRRRRYLEVQQA